MIPLRAMSAMLRNARSTSSRSERLSRREARAVLARAGVSFSRLRLRDAVHEALTNVSRAPHRTVLTSMGTALAVATAVGTIGLGNSANGAVSAAFNELRATTVTFTERNPQTAQEALSESSATSLRRLHGVVSAGLMSNLGGAQLYSISRLGPADLTRDGSASLPVTAASSGALATAGAAVSSGRLFDEGMDRRHDLVALLGQAAAQQLGITSIALSPAVYISGVRFTAIGIVRSSTLADQLLLGVVIPPGAVKAIPGAENSTKQIIVRTQPGAAQLVGREGPYVVDPYDPGGISSEVPVDPTQLRNQVNGEVTTLLLAVAVVTMIVGTISIANVTLLSVIQRRSEIGLRRSIGAAPRHIAALILGEAALTGGIGGLIGTSMAVLVVATVSASKGWLPVLDPAVVILAPLGGGAAGLMAGLYPAWRGSRVTPISALQR